MLMEQTLQTLKELRLPGMAAAFEEQQTHAATAGLSFDERFSMLVDREQCWRDNRRVARLLRDAKLKTTQACLEDVRYGGGRKLDKAQIAQLASCQWIAAGESAFRHRARDAVVPRHGGLRGLHQLPAVPDTDADRRISESHLRRDGADTGADPRASRSARQVDRTVQPVRKWTARFQWRDHRRAGQPDRHSLVAGALFDGVACGLYCAAGIRDEDALKSVSQALRDLPPHPIR